MENCVWIYNKTPKIIIQQNTDTDKDILNILINRNLDSKEKIDHFLSAGLEDIFDPFLFEDMKKTINRINSSILSKEKICVYGDYDVDGVTSTSLFVLVMRNLNVEVDYYIPKREEGYGLNNNAIKSIYDSGCRLLITVDCGISSNNEIDYANSLGLDTIITDHHEITGFLPDAFSIVNPKRNENLYPFKSLAGVGTIFMVLYALYSSHNKKEEMYQFLDLVAIGTVADIVPLVEENRIFVKNGIPLLNHTKNKGLSILLKKLFENNSSRSYTTYDIGYRIAPVFNAAGRLDDAKIVVRLLTEDDEFLLSKICDDIINKNTERQVIEKEIIKKIEKYITDNHLESKGVIITHDPSFHHGVIGIAASKITDKYYKPSIIMEMKDNGTSVGSARSIEKFNIIKAITSMKDLLVKYGGHEAAAGFTIHSDKLEEFKERMYKEAEISMNQNDYIRPIHIDTDLNFFKISLEFYFELAKLAPFGFGNPNPIFSISSVEIKNIRIIGKTQDHLMFDISKGSSTIKNCVWFGKADFYAELFENVFFDIAFKLDINHFNDRTSVKVMVESVKVSKAALTSDNSFYYYFDLYNTKFPLTTIFYSKNPNFEKSGVFFLDFDNSFQSITVKQGQKIVGNLSSELSFVLKFLYDNYNFKFHIEIISADKTTSNFNITAVIKRTYEFKTLSFNAPSIFKDIKEFLICGFDYNAMQKLVLKSLVHEKSDTLLISKKGRGVKTVVLTLAIYLWHKNGHKSLFVSDDTITDSLMCFYFEIIKPIKVGNISKYPFAVFYNVTPQKKNPNINFIFSEEDISVDGFNKIIDPLIIPETLNIIAYENYDIDTNNTDFFHPFLPKDEKIRFSGKIQNKEPLSATKEILSFL